MARRGPKIKAKLTSSLRQCLEDARADTAVPYRVIFQGQEYYINTTSASNAVRMAAYLLGMKTQPVGVNEIIEALRPEKKNKS
jgi:hypothetical protein